MILTIVWFISILNRSTGYTPELTLSFFEIPSPFLNSKYYLKETFLVKRINNENNFTFLEYEINAVSFVCYLQKVTKLLVEENKNINTKVCVDTKTKYVWKITTFLYQMIKTVTLHILLIQYFKVYNILCFNLSIVAFK